MSQPNIQSETEQTIDELTEDILKKYPSLTEQEAEERAKDELENQWYKYKGL